MKREGENEKEFVVVDEACGIYPDLLRAEKREPLMTVDSEQMWPSFCLFVFFPQNPTKNVR